MNAELGKLLVQDIGKHLQGGLSQQHVTITSYEMCRKIPQAICRGHKFVILDESHCAKNPTTQITRYLTPIVQQAKHAVLMTGTPIKGKPVDYYSQVLHPFFVY